MKTAKRTLNIAGPLCGLSGVMAFCLGLLSLGAFLIYTAAVIAAVWIYLSYRETRNL